MNATTSVYGRRGGFAGDLQQSYPPTPAAAASASPNNRVVQSGSGGGTSDSPRRSWVSDSAQYSVLTCFLLLVLPFSRSPGKNIGGGATLIYHRC